MQLPGGPCCPGSGCKGETRLVWQRMASGWRRVGRWEWGQKTVGSAVRGTLLVIASWAVTLSEPPLPIRSWQLKLSCVCVCVCVRVWMGVCVYVGSVESVSLRPHGLEPTRLLCPWVFPGKNTGVGAAVFCSRGSS